MTNRERRFFSGQTLQQAIIRAASFFRCAPDELAYHEVEKRHGFVRARRGVVIEVDPEAPRRTAEPATRALDEVRRAKPAGEEALAPVVEEPTPEAPVAAPEESAPVAAESSATAPEEDLEEEHDDEEPALFAAGPISPRERLEVAVGEEADAALKASQLLFQLAGLRLHCTVYQDEEGLLLEIGGADQERLVADRGKVLLAIQHLMPRVLWGMLGRTIPCRVDSENFHEIRQERLRDLAQNAASAVRRQGRPRQLEPMAPDERRIVHLTLADDPAVITESIGDGFYKRIKILPAEGPRRGRR